MKFVHLAFALDTDKEYAHEDVADWLDALPKEEKDKLTALAYVASNLPLTGDDYMSLVERADEVLASRKADQE